MVDLEEPNGSRFLFPLPGPLQGVKTRGKAILKLEEVSYCYPNSSEPAVRPLSLVVSQASRVALLGPMGSGRSTLLQLLEGRHRPTKGRLLRVLGARGLLEKDRGGYQRLWNEIWTYKYDICFENFKTYCAF